MGHVIMGHEGRPVFMLTQETPSRSVWTLVSDVEWIYDHVLRPVDEEQLLANADDKRTRRVRFIHLFIPQESIEPILS